MSNKVYKKRAGTSGIQGQLYETKLISLINFRAIHDDNITQFSLATNVDEIGAFDDICIKATVQEFNKPIAVFIQAKHRENEKLLTLNSKADLAKYFDSYLDIRRTFKQGKDPIFGSKFEDVDPYFVLYTTAKDDPNNTTFDGEAADFLNELIGTGDCCTQASYRNDDLDFLCKIVMQEQLTSLAGLIAKYVVEGCNGELSMNNDLILRYHVILATNVFDVSEVQPEGHRNASFREDFFDLNDEFVVLFKNVMCLEVIIKKKVNKSDRQSLITIFLNNTSDVKTLSELLGPILTFKNGKLEFIGKSVSSEIKRQLVKADVPDSVVFKSAELATKEYLLSLKFKVPAFFGNKDLAIRGDTEKRLKHLTYKIVELAEQATDNVITIDESLGEGFLRLNGGIASAVGNILVFDETTKHFKFTNDTDSLGYIAKMWYDKLKTQIENIYEYKLDVKVKKFPKLSFERGEYDVNLVRDFYNKLLFYTSQADQNGVEEILRREIEDHPCTDINNFKVRSDVIFLKYHDEIQRLWMTSKEGAYLTKKTKIYENAVTNTMAEPLIGIVNMMHKIKNKDYAFHDNAIQKLTVNEILHAVITTENCILTAAKVEQYLGNKDHAVLDLEYIFKLPTKNHNTLCKELTNAKDKILIFVCNNYEDSRSSIKKLESIVKAVKDKQIIVITNEMSAQIMTKNFSLSMVIKDEGTVLTDLTEESQQKVLAISRLYFQNQDLSLDVIIDSETAKFVDQDTLNKITNNETIIVGKTVVNYTYEKAKHFYIDRRVIRRNENNDIKGKILHTLYDLEDKVVLITALPGMGKSTLLTHLALKTKEMNPKVWIVRINLLEHTRAFSRWQDEKIVIDALECLNFMCHAAVNDSKDSEEDDELEIVLEEANGFVSLDKCSGDAATVFQLNIFLNIYNNGELIFLFDGFDEIFPHYAKEALSLVKTVKDIPRGHKIWITSRSFNHIRSILEAEFEPSYEIEHFTRYEQDTYLYTFWRTKLQFENLNSKQLDNVHDFVNFIQGLLPRNDFCIHGKLQHKPYFKIYLNFLEYLKSESVIAGTDFCYDAYNSYMTEFDLKKSVITNFINDFIAPPLHLFLLADYFYNKIKDVDNTGNKWDVDVTEYIFYEYYLETKLKKIRFKEKNKIDVSMPDNKIAYEKERLKCVDKHKKLGAYAIFYPIIEIFDEDVLIEIKNTIEELTDGRDKTGLIRTVADNIPLFVHMSFAEYFAVEYICDLLKKDNLPEIQEKIWKFIIRTMFENYDINIFDIFNIKIKMDDELNDIVQRDKSIIFNIMYEKKNKGTMFRFSDYERVDKVNRGIDHTVTDRNILKICNFSQMFDNGEIDENTPVDFLKFFHFFYFVAKQGPDGIAFTAVTV